jgi:nucleotide-binding universal stress UspA family protein
MDELSHILVPIDLSPASRTSLDYAAFLARNFHASIDVVHVWRAPMPALGYDTPLLNTSESIFAITRAHASEELQSFLRPLRERGLSVSGHLEAGDPLDAIVRLSSSGLYDLIVMAAHGRSGVANLLHRHLAEKLVRRAPCPVLTLRVVDDSAAKKRRAARPSIEAAP